MLRWFALAIAAVIATPTLAADQTVCKLGTRPAEGWRAGTQPTQWTGEHIYVRDGVLRFYTIDEKQLAVKLKKPQKASELPELVAEKDFVTEHDDDPLLTYKGPLGESTSVAVYDVAEACQHPAERLWLARKLMKELSDDVEVAGVPLLVAEGFATLFATGEVVVELSEDLTLDRTTLPDSLVDYGLDLRQRDPFDPARTILIDLLESPNPKEADLARGLDCIASYGKPKPGADALRERIRTNTCLSTLTAAIQAAVETIRNVYPVTVAAVPSSIESGFDDWKTAEKKKEDNFGTTVTVNSVSNEAGDRQDSKLSVDVKGAKGIYPGQFRLSVGAQVRFDEDEVEEDVTTILVNYDHYFERWLEAYAFIERLTDNFLSIEQRYEAGVGFLLEHDARAPTRDGFCGAVGINQHAHERHPRDVAMTARARQSLRVWRQRMRTELLRKGRVSKETAEEYCTYKRSIEKNHAKLQVSLAFSAFLDLEQPEALPLELSTPDDSREPMKATVAPDSSQEYRVTVRPAITVRPNDKVTLSGYWYLKHAIDEQQDLPDEDDVREEWNVTASLALSDKDPKVALTASVTQYHDPLPPRITGEAALAAFDMTNVTAMAPFPDTIQLPDGREITGLVARATHTVLKFGLSVSF